MLASDSSATPGEDSVGPTRYDPETLAKALSRFISSHISARDHFRLWEMLDRSSAEAGVDDCRVDSDTPDVSQCDRIAQEAKRLGVLRDSRFYVSLAAICEREILEIDHLAKNAGVTISWPKQCKQWSDDGRKALALAIWDRLEKTDQFRAVFTPEETYNTALQMSAVRDEMRRKFNEPASGDTDHRGVAKETFDPDNGASMAAAAKNSLDRYITEVANHVKHSDAVAASLRTLTFAHACGPSGDDLKKASILVDEAKAHRASRPGYTPAASRRNGELLRKITGMARDLVTRQRAMPTVVSSDRKATVVCRALGKTFDGFELGGVTMALAPGQRALIVGPNGSGKSTLLRLLSGEIAASSGELEYPDLCPATGRNDWQAIRRQIGYVSQHLAPWPGRVVDNLHAWASYLGYRGNENVAEVKYVVQCLDLERHWQKTWDELSGGYRLRYEIARAQLGKPRLLVLDEPLAMLDASTRNVILETLSSFSDAEWRPTVILSAQSIYEIEKWADYLVALHEDGGIVYQGAPDAIRRESPYRMFEVAPIEHNTILDEIDKIPGCAIDSWDGIVLLKIPRDPPLGTPEERENAGKIERLLAELSVGTETRYMRDISSSVVRLQWEARNVRSSKP